MPPTMRELSIGLSRFRKKRRSTRHAIESPRNDRNQLCEPKNDESSRREATDRTEARTPRIGKER
jgi:hypothetical protein